MAGGGGKDPGKAIAEAIPLIALNFIPGVGELADAAFLGEAGAGAAGAAGLGELGAAAGEFSATAGALGAGEALGGAGLISEGALGTLGAVGGGEALEGGAAGALGSLGSNAAGTGAGSGAGVLGGLADSLTGGAGAAAGGAGSAVGEAAAGAADVAGGVGTAASPITSAPIAGTTPGALTDPFGVAGAGGASGVGDTVAAAPATAEGGSSAFLSSFGGETGQGGAAAGAAPAAGSADYGALAGPQAAGAASPQISDTLAQAGITPDSNLFGGLKDFWKANKDWIGLAGTGASVGHSLLKGNQPPGGAEIDAKRKQLLDSLIQRSQQLASGQLTPEQTQQFQNDLAAHLSQIDAKYGQLGMSNSTAHLQERAAAQALTSGHIGKMQSQQTGQGLQGLGLSANVADRLAQEQMAQDDQLAQALARLAAAGMAA